jgi:nucleoside-diphosphate-sugar epimerase
MKVFIAGATGVVGSRLVPLLVERGHAVTGSTRTAAKAERIRSQGATPAVIDALDAAAVKEVVAEAEPEVVVVELTAIPAAIDFRHFDRQFEPTNRLRTIGTDNLVAAASAVGARRMVAQSFAPLPYERTGGPVKTEEDPFDPHPPEQARAAVEALKHLESAVLDSGLEPIILRYGGFYGPGTSFAAGTPMVEMVRKRRVPIVGSGGGVWSFAHADDVAAATAIAVERGEPGVYNVTDDDPAPVREWLPVLAEAIGAAKPRRVPVWLARLLVGELGVVMMTEIRGASNAKAKRELGWTLRYPSWREGFRTGLGA